MARLLDPSHACAHVSKRGINPVEVSLSAFGNVAHLGAPKRSLVQWSIAFDPKPQDEDLVRAISLWVGRVSRNRHG